jgi:hypothetical protein
VREIDLAMTNGNKNQAVISIVRKVFKHKALWENGTEKSVFCMGKFGAHFQRSYLNLAVKDEC